jgi:hypothetical protein
LSRFGRLSDEEIQDIEFESLDGWSWSLSDVEREIAASITRVAMALTNYGIIRWSAVIALAEEVDRSRG